MECFYNLVQYALFLQAIYFLESEIYYRLFWTLQTSVRIASTTFCCLFTKHIHNMTRHYRHTLEFFQTCEKREKYYCFVFLLFVFAHNKDENLWALDVPSTLYIACKLYVKKGKIVLQYLVETEISIRTIIEKGRGLHVIQLRNVIISKAM